jgi:putative transposase
MSTPDRRKKLNGRNRVLSVRRQCTLMGLARSGVYRTAKPAKESDGALMRRIDELYTCCPFYGTRRIAFELKANRKRVQRLMRLMGLEALGPKPNTSHLCLVAIMDWASRAVLSWRLSNTMDVSFCVEALEEALARFGKPEIFNSDQSLPSRRRGAASSPAPLSPACSKEKACKSRWTVAAAGWTMSSSRGCGAA